MPSTFAAVAVLVVALLPGALYVWSFERLVGRWGIGLSDRLLRFVGGSAIIHALLAPATYWFWSAQWPHLRAGDSVSWWLWPLTVGYAAVPIVAGSTIGWATRLQKTWARWFTGPDPAPRAWDHVFQQQAAGWVRLRLKSGSWLGGAYANAESGRKSYAAGYPEPQDIFLAAAADVDPDTGDFRYDENDEVIVLDGGLLVRWDEVEYLQFIDS